MGAPELEEERRLIARLRRHFPLIGYFARRDLKSLYKRSVLGWTWSMLNPLSTILVYSFVFSVIFRVQPPPTASGTTNFALFLFSGLVTWTFFSAMLTGAMGWLSSIGDLRRKIYFPPEVAILGNASAMAIQTGIEAAVLVAIMVIIGNVGPTTLLLPVVLLLAALFGLGIGFVVAVMNARFKDTGHLVGIALQAAFVLTPIMYPINIVPERARGVPLREIIQLNPVNQFVAAGRDLVYHLQLPTWRRWTGLVLITVVVFTVGYRFFAKRSMALTEEM